MEAGKPGKANLRNKESVESSLSFFSPPFVTLISGFFFSRYPDRLLMLVSFAIKTQLKAPNAPNYNAFQCFFFILRRSFTERESLLQSIIGDKARDPKIVGFGCLGMSTCGISNIIPPLSQCFQNLGRISIQTEQLSFFNIDINIRTIRRSKDSEMQPTSLRLLKCLS